MCIGIIYAIPVAKTCITCIGRKSLKSLYRKGFIASSFFGVGNCRNWLSYMLVSASVQKGLDKKERKWLRRGGCFRLASLRRC